MAQNGTRRQGTDTITIKGVPTKAKFPLGIVLIYNTKGTTNPDADNYVTVSAVNGPTKYTWVGSWPVNN